MTYSPLPGSQNIVLLFEAMVNFFEEDDWDFHQIDNKPIITLSIAGENGSWRCLARVDEEEEYFAFYSICPVNAPEPQRLAMAEFLTRVNQNLRLGNFEMDFKDGEIRYKTSAIFQGYHLTNALFEHWVYANIQTMDLYLPGILRVLYGGFSPEKVIAEIEQYLSDEFEN